MLNSFIGMGRLTREPEIRTTATGTMNATFSIAIDRDYDRDKTDFLTCVAWGKTAEFVSKYFHKGMMAIVEGRMQSDSWTKDGQKRTSWEVLCYHVRFGESKKSDTPQFVEVEDDEEMPF